MDPKNLNLNLNFESLFFFSLNKNKIFHKIYKKNFSRFILE
jgi:hypothetical protein